MTVPEKRFDLLNLRHEGRWNLGEGIHLYFRE
jgi:hypothetical protein